MNDIIKSGYKVDGDGYDVETFDATGCGKMNNLTSFHIAILHHTVYRAAGGRYCGGGEHMNDLVDCGLMRPIPSPKWCPDSFFTITDNGREQLKLHQ